MDDRNSEGFSTITPEEARAMMDDGDVVILDVMLPKIDGFTVVSNLRRAGVNTPVLLLTARDAVPDKICGLDSGADVYMT